MKNTNYSLTLQAAMLLCVSTLTASAGIIGTSNESINYLKDTGFPSKWSSGVYFGSGKRIMEYGNYGDVEMDIARFGVDIGYQVSRWADLFVTAGAADNTVLTDSESDYSADLGAGLSMNLLDHEILDPTLFENRLRVNALAKYGFSEVEGDYGDSIALHEAYCSLLVGIVNDIEGKSLYTLEGISLAAGPAFSMIMGDGMDSKDNFGISANAEFWVTKRVSLHAGADFFGSDSSVFCGGLHVRF